MSVIRKGIAKLGIFTIIAATTVCLVLVGIFVRLGDTLPNIMLSPFLPPYVSETDATVAEVQCTAEEEEIDSAKKLRAFVETLTEKNETAFAVSKEAGALHPVVSKNSVKRRE